jgi:hypothetical protein
LTFNLRMGHYWYGKIKTKERRCTMIPEFGSLQFWVNTIVVFLIGLYMGYRYKP